MGGKGQAVGTEAARMAWLLQGRVWAVSGKALGASNTGDEIMVSFVLGVVEIAVFQLVRL
jgi:hypothetical protein